MVHRHQEGRLPAQLGLAYLQLGRALQRRVESHERRPDSDGLDSNSTRTHLSRFAAPLYLHTVIPRSHDGSGGRGDGPVAVLCQVPRWVLRNSKTVSTSVAPGRSLYTADTC